MKIITFIPTLAAMIICHQAIAKQHQPDFSDYPEMTFACENSQIENQYVALKVDTKSSTLYIYHGADHITAYRIGFWSAEPGVQTTDAFGIPLKTLPWDMGEVGTNDQRVLMNKNEGIWYMQEHDNYYRCVPNELYWRAYEMLDAPK